MKVGTKSILFGVHQFMIHPFVVAVAWIKLYGFPFDPRIWIAFFIHDLGYLGKADMDGEEGDRHPELGAKLMSVFGKKWSDFCLYHSRFYAKKANARPSKLCMADKKAITILPGWFYLPFAKATGELKEYMERSASGDARTCKYYEMNLHNEDPKKWYAGVQDYVQKWVDEHKDGREDTWTNHEGGKDEA